MPLAESIKFKESATILVIVLIGLFLLVSLWGFSSAFLGAVILYIILSPFAKHLINKEKISHKFAVIITLILSLLIVLVPALGLTWLMTNKISTLVSGSQDLYQYISSFNESIKNSIGFDFLSEENFNKIKDAVAGFIPKLLGETFNIGFNLLLMFFILYYLLDSHTDMELKILDALPYEKDNAVLFTRELRAQTYANAVGAPLLAIIQGILSTFGFWLFEVKDPFFWGVICGLISFFPMIGTPMVWVPAAIVLLSSGYQWQGVGLLVYGSVVIVGFDYFFRILIQKKMAQVHPIITIFGIIMGVHWFGIPGFIFGPLLISYFLLMIRVYKSEYGRRKKLIVPEDLSNSSVVQK